MSTDSFNQDIEKGNYSHDSNHSDISPQAITNQDGGRTHKVISTFRHDKQHIYINDQPIDKDDFIYAFGGNLNVGAYKETDNAKKYANPVPAGLAAFSCTTMTLGLIQMHAKEVHHANTLIGALITTSGIVELIVGILCFIINNTWACCTFLMFGGFWSSYGLLLSDVGGVASAYDTVDEYGQSVALYFLPWAIFSFLLWATTWRSTWPLTILMFFVWFFVLLFTIAQFIGSVKLYKAGGFFCLMSGVFGFYNMFAGVADHSNSYVTIHPMFLPNAYKGEEEKTD